MAKDNNVTKSGVAEGKQSKYLFTFLIEIKWIHNHNKKHYGNSNQRPLSFILETKTFSNEIAHRK